MSEEKQVEDTDIQLSLSTDRALSLLSDPRRRQLLIELAERKPDAEMRVDSDSLEQELLRTQSGLRFSSVDADRIIISMHHTHLPKLADHDVIEWNEWDDTIERGAAFDALEPFIECLDRHREELPSDWRCVRSISDG